MRHPISRVLFVGALLCSLAASSPQFGAGDLPFPPSKGKVAISVPTDTTEHTSGGFRFVPVGTLIKALDGSDLSLITTDMLEATDSTTTATMVEPLAFSPNGRRIAVKGSLVGGERIYIVDEGQSRPTWVTRNQIERRDRVATYPYNHNQVLWSSDSERLAVFTFVGHEGLISLAEEDSLRTLFSYDLGGDTPTELPMIWSVDGSALYAGLHMGPKHWRVVRVPVGHEETTTIFDGREIIWGMAGNPPDDALAFNMGSSLYLSNGATVEKVFTAPWIIKSIFWSKDRARLALSCFGGEIVIIQRDGRNPWSVTEGIGEKWVVRNIAWLDDRQFAFILVMSNPSVIKLYLGDVATHTIRVVPTGEIASTEVQAISGGVLYFKVISQGEWAEWEPRGELDIGSRLREVCLDRYYWHPGDSAAIRLSNSAFRTMEYELGEGPIFYPVLWGQPE